MTPKTTDRRPGTPLSACGSFPADGTTFDLALSGFPPLFEYAPSAHIPESQRAAWVRSFSACHRHRPTHPTDGIHEQTGLSATV